MNTSLGWLKHNVVKILSCDEDGKMAWQKVEAVTQHPVINKDGSNTLLHVKLHSGREVIATKAKSFLTRQNNKIVGTTGDDINVGDYLPVSTVLPIDDDIQINHIDLAEYSDFTDKRSGSAHLPDQIPLDAAWGSFFGSYLSEGSAETHFVSITNGNSNFQARVIALCSKYNISWRLVTKKTRTLGFGDSTALILSSTQLAQLLTNLFGNRSGTKRIPGKLLAGPPEFLQSLIGAYFDGDGSMTKRQYEIRSYSISHGLLEDLQQILTRFKVQCDVTQEGQAVFEQRRIKYPSTTRGWYLHVRSANTNAFKNSFLEYFVVKEKRDRLAAMKSRLLFGFKDKIPNVVLSSHGTVDVKRSSLQKLRLQCASCPEDKDVIDKLLSEDIFYDKIISIEEVEYNKPFVYDLTVENTRNFNTASGLALRDTFHQSGIATQFNVVDGVPRLEELISASKKPKAPAITIYLKPEYAEDEDRAEVIRNKLRQTRLSDLAKCSEIVYDPSDETTLVEGDAEFIQTFYAYMKENHCTFDSAWVLRLELDRRKMLDRNIRMWEIEHALLDRFTDQIQCIFADDNAKQLIIRIRVSNDAGLDRPEDDQDVIFLLKQLEKSIMESLILRGIPGIRNAFLPTREQRPCVESIDEHGAVVTSADKKEIVIVAEQHSVSDNSLLEIFKLPEVDTYRTISNYVGDIYQMFGVEAARNLLAREIRKVFITADINHRHIDMLVDTMTSNGALISVSRVGVHKLNVGPLARSSFEETEQQFTNAAAFAEEDNFSGISSNTMLGQLIPAGTGECEVLLDEQTIMENSRSLQSIPEESDEEDLDEDVDTLDDSQLPDLGFDFALEDTVPGRDHQYRAGEVHIETV